MKRWFEMKSSRNTNDAGYQVGPSPSGSEELGGSLMRFAQCEAERMADAPGDYWKATVIQIFLLAADAYSIGAAASIGHNRTARYYAQRDRCIMLAKELGYEQDS